MEIKSNYMTCQSKWKMMMLFVDIWRGFGDMFVLVYIALYSIFTAAVYSQVIVATHKQFL